MQSANYKLSHNYGTLRFWDYTDLNSMDFRQHGYGDISNSSSETFNGILKQYDFRHHKKAGPEGPAFSAR